MDIVPMRFESNTRPPAITHINTKIGAVGMKSYIVLLRYRKEEAHMLSPSQKKSERISNLFAHKT